jgi:hypothetical protein
MIDNISLVLFAIKIKKVCVFETIQNCQQKTKSFLVMFHSCPQSKATTKFCIEYVAQENVLNNV